MEEGEGLVICSVGKGRERGIDGHVSLVVRGGMVPIQWESTRDEQYMKDGTNLGSDFVLF
jgi:hypothetical protein